MAKKLNTELRRVSWLFLAMVLLCSGCATTRGGWPAHDGTAPRELSKMLAPEYVISPPDVLSIDAVRLVPQPPYKIAPLDALYIQVTVGGAKEEEKNQLVPGQPISGLYRVEAEGVINLGFSYGTVPVLGLAIPDAKEAIKTFLKKRFTAADFEVDVSLAESRAMQFIRGEHLVQPDGKVTLGNYGRVLVAGKTMDQARKSIQDFLADKVLEPEISLDVVGFNSMVYYVVFDLDGQGQRVTRLPFTGNETVLDAISSQELRGLPPGSDRLRIWVSRPIHPEEGHEQVMPVDWQAITKKGSTATNYQLLPGDRLYVAVDPLVEVDGFLARLISPFERVLGIALLGNSTVLSFRNTNGTNGNNGGL
jgi:polysaccharide biosynthesis/export protein